MAQDAIVSILRHLLNRAYGPYGAYGAPSPSPLGRLRGVVGLNCPHLRRLEVSYRRRYPGSLLLPPWWHFPNR